MEELAKEIDIELLEFNNCDIFTPDDISKQMASYLHNEGILLEPAVGKGNLLTNINLNAYNHIDVYDIRQNYLDEFKNELYPNMKKKCEDFLSVYIKKNV